MSEHLRLPRGLPDEAYDLGEPTDEFMIGAGRTAAKLAVGLICLLLGIGFGILTVLLFATMEPGPAGGVRPPLYLGVVSVALIIGGIAIPVRVLRQSGLRVMACPGGLVYTHGDEVEVIDWGDVDEVRYEVLQAGHAGYGGAYPRYRVTRHSDGREFTFDSYLPNLRALARIIERQTLKHILPEEQQAFDDGKVIRFGPLAVGRKGIRKHDEWLRWADVKEVTLERGKGQIVISKEDKWMAWHRQLVNDVPNYHVFLELVRDEMSR
jgi:hypothetical protein